MEELKPVSEQSYDLRVRYRVNVMSHRHGKVFVVEWNDFFTPWTQRDTRFNEYRKYSQDRFMGELYRALTKHDALFESSIGKLEISTSVASYLNFDSNKPIDEQVASAVRSTL